MKEYKECIVKLRYGMEVGYGQEIVRCKDCKHKDGCDPFLLFGNDDWFCADGEPKEQT